MLVSGMGAIRPRVARAALLGALAAAFSLPFASVALAAANQLSSPVVTPASGDTNTIFSFSVHYTGAAATSVTALVGSKSIPLTLTSGSATDGTYTGTSKLASGTWSVTFVAVATKRNSPTLAGPTLTVAPAPPPPTPAPVPTVAPTAVPTPVPAAAPPAPKPASPPPVAPAATPVAVIPASGSPLPVAVAPVGSVDVVPSAAGVASVTPGDTDLAPALFWPVMLGGFGLIGLVVAYSVFAMGRDRRRQELAAEMALAAQQSNAAEGTDKPQRPIAPWELDARLDEVPIGTVEYVAQEDGSATLTLPEGQRNPAPKRGNPRMARIAEARKGR
jgi:hypothetical protein